MTALTASAAQRLSTSLMGRSVMTARWSPPAQVRALYPSRCTAITAARAPHHRVVDLVGLTTKPHPWLALNLRSMASASCIVRCFSMLTTFPTEASRAACGTEPARR
jgi:hypothetical protein